MKDRNVIELDITRSLAIIAVVILHLTTVIITFPQKVINLNQFLFIDQVLRFSVPVFIFVSGVGLGLSFKKKPKNYLEFLKSRMQKILPLYIIFSFIYFFFPKPLSTHYISGFICALFIGKANFHLYFIPIIVQLYTIFPFLYLYSKNFKFVLTILLVNFLILMCVDHNFLTYGFFKYLLDWNSFIFWSFYFIFGIYCSYNISRIKDFLIKYKNYLMVIFLIAGLLIVFDSTTSIKPTGQILIKNICFLRPSVMLYTLSFLALIFSLNWKNPLLNNIFNYLSKASYVIYLSHVAFLQVFNKLYNHFFDVYNSFYLISGFIFALIGSLLTYEILLKIKYINRYV